MIRSGDDGFASDAYLRVKAQWKGLPAKLRAARKSGRTQGSSPFSKGRDPKTLGDVLALASRDMGWSVELEQARLISDWSLLVGETISPHTRVLELRDNLLIVQCDSTAWATELRRMRAEILTRILADYEDSGVEDLRFLAPGAPSWRHGSRVIKGRGPRDTYG